MAGDWIKMRCDLWDDPRVVSMKRTLKIPHASVIGGLFRLWTLADQHSEDGELCGYTAADLDELCGKKGWADALAAIGWLEVFHDKIIVPRFEEHNGKSGKKRAQDYKDQQRHRSKGSVRKVSGSDPDKQLTREEKRESKSRGRAEDVDVDGAKVSCSQEEHPDFSRLFSLLLRALPTANPNTREWMAKAVILFIRGRIPEAAFNDVMESPEAKKQAGDKVDDHGGWAWVLFENQCISRNINWRRELMLTVIPEGWEK